MTDDEITDEDRGSLLLALADRIDTEQIDQESISVVVIVIIIIVVIVGGGNELLQI